MNVRSFKDEKYLTKPRDSPVVEPIQDIGEVAEDDLPQESTTLSGMEIIGVQSLQYYSSCIACVQCQGSSHRRWTCFMQQMFNGDAFKKCNNIISLFHSQVTRASRLRPLSCPSWPWGSSNHLQRRDHKIGSDLFWPGSSPCSIRTYQSTHHCYINFCSSINVQPLPIKQCTLCLLSLSISSQKTVTTTPSHPNPSSTSSFTHTECFTSTTT